MLEYLNRYFRISAQGSNFRTEILGGVTTFMAMAYIIVVNPAILGSAELPDGRDLSVHTGALMVATILTAVFGSLLMGVYARRPIAVAPYMGENAFIAIGMAHMGMIITWEMRLSSVFFAGILFLILTLLGLRRWLADSISPSMKNSFAVGIGLFLFLVGVTQTGIIVNGLTGQQLNLATEPGILALQKNPPIKLGNLKETRVLLAIAGFVLITTLMYWRVRGGILIGIVVTGIAGFALNLSSFPKKSIFALPTGESYNLGAIAGTPDLSILRLEFFPILLTLLLISFLDTLGTLVAVGSAGGMLDEKGNMKDMQKPMIVDSLSCIFGGLVGTSTSGAFIESTIGVREGARTGLAAVVTALLFAVSLLFLPLFEPFHSLKYAYCPALMAVGVLMIGTISKIDFEDLTEAVPALVTITMMLFTFNIANGLTAGLVFYPVMKFLCGKWREINLGMLVLGLMCLAYYLFGKPH